MVMSYFLVLTKNSSNNRAMAARLAQEAASAVGAEKVAEAVAVVVLQYHVG
jgi:hypothetical protein